MRRACLLAATSLAVLAPSAAAAGPELEAQPRATVLAGDGVRVAGEVPGAAAGREVVVRLFRDGRKVLARRARTNAAGRFGVRLDLRTPGRLEARAVAVTGGAAARPLAITVLPRRLSPGARGRGVRLVQARLAALGYVVGARGLLDARTARAVLAFRKVAGMARTTAADGAFLRALARGAGRLRVRFPRHGRHVEADLSRQVVALVDGARVLRIYPTSTGAPATPTVLGSFRVYRKDPGTNALGMVHSAYFHRGYAIHGFASVPTYNASHGCLRVPIPDARSIFDWIRFGTRVDVYP